MLRYDPGDSFGHRLDPRTKLGFQLGFTAAAFAYTTVTGLLVLTGVVGVALLSCRLAPRQAFGEFTGVLPFLAAGPLLEALTFGRSWVVPADAVSPALASYRTLLILGLAAAYVKTTPVRESEAAVAWAIPGRVGRFFGVGVALVFRFLPVLQGDLRRARQAMHARLGDTRPVHERVRLVATGGLRRAFGRADRLALALRARCFSWNATLPPLELGPVDYPVLVGAVGLVLVAIA